MKKKTMEIEKFYAKNVFDKINLFFEVTQK